MPFSTAQNRTVALIPARGGSKSIPYKNIKELNGRPLIYWTIDAAVGCKSIDSVYISTDSEKIKSVVQNYGSPKVNVVSRSAESASDIASTEMVMLEFAKDHDFENICLIQATSPLLESQHLDQAFELYYNENINSIVSVVRQKRFIWCEDDLGIRPLNYDPRNRPRRQEYAGYLVENGAFYITKKELLNKSGCRISGNIGFIELPDETYFEIDEPSDWDLIGELLARRMRKSAW